MIPSSQITLFLVIKSVTGGNWVKYPTKLFRLNKRGQKVSSNHPVVKTSVHPTNLNREFLASRLSPFDSILS
jgi:hypothetical protein